MSRVAMHLVVAVGCPAVREENHDLVNRLRVLREVVLQKLSVCNYKHHCM